MSYYGWLCDLHCGMYTHLMQMYYDGTNATLFKHAMKDNEILPLKEYPDRNHQCLVFHNSSQN